MWAAELRHNRSNSILHTIENIVEDQISLGLRDGLECEAAKVVALEKVVAVEDTTSEVFDVDAGEVVGLAVEVTANVEEFGAVG